jgi:FdhE protein
VLNLEHARRLASPEEIAVRAGEQAPFLRLPDPAREFAQRQARLLALADDHPMREYLLFVAAIAGAQQQAVAALTLLELRDALRLKVNSDFSGVPLPALGWPRDPAWRQALRGMLATLAPQLASAAAGESVRRLAAESDAFYESQADRLLGGITVGLDLGAAPLIGAALQVYWVRLVADTAARYGDSIFGRSAPESVCPCCGFRPTASVVRIGGMEYGYRYLHCALCCAQWHLVRIKCSHCLGTKSIHYQALDAVDSKGSTAARDRSPIAAVRAECCDGCGHYLKIFSMEKDPDVEPVADDLATVALDLLVSESGKTCSGINLMLLYGDPGDG